MAVPTALPPNPTNADLARGQMEIHLCLEQTAKKIDGITQTLDGLNRAAWKVVGLVLMTILVAALGTATAVISNSINLHDQTQAKTEQVAHALAERPADAVTKEDLAAALQGLKR